MSNTPQEIIGEDYIEEQHKKQFLTDFLVYLAETHEIEGLQDIDLENLANQYIKEVD